MSFFGSETSTRTTTQVTDSSANAGTNSTAEAFSLGNVTIDDGTLGSISLDRSTNFDLTDRSDNSLRLRDDSITTEEGGISVRGGKVESTKLGDNSIAQTGAGKSRNAGRDVLDVRNTQAVNASGGSNVTIQDGSEAALALANNAIENLKTAQLETINATRSTIERVTASAERQSETAIENLTDNKADPLASNNIKTLLIAGIIGIAAIVWAFARRPSSSSK